MKTRNYIFAAAITIFAAFSCQKAEIEEIKDSIQSEGNLVPVTFTISNENTKTYLDGMSVLWTGEEKVAVWDGVAVREFSVTLEGSDVSMSGEVDASATDLIAAYPYSEAISVKDGVVTTSLSAQQSLGTQSVSDGALLSVATFTKGEDVTFRNVCSLLKVTVEEETANLKEIVIDAPGICGEVQIDAASAQVVSMGDASSIRVSRSDSENIVPGVYCVAVIPGQYKAGELKVRMAYADEGDGVQAGSIEQAAVTGKDVTLQRNKAYDFASTTATGTAERHIHNAEELVAWNSLESGMNTYPVFLDGDCDMSGMPWTAKGLTTSFNGQNHKIYNFVTGNAGNTGVFTSISGKGDIQNLIVGSADGETYDGVSCITISSATALTSFAYAAGIVGYLNGNGSVKNCVNFAKIVADADNVTKVRLGGIAGGSNAVTATIENCVNRGEIVVMKTAADLSANSNVGGIIGWSDGDITLKDCVNKGYVHTDNHMINRLAGICGGSVKNIVIDNCDNEGVIKYEIANDRAVFVAGIISTIGAAAATGSAAVVQNCDNTGEVSLYDATNFGKDYAAIAGVAAQVNLVGTFSNNTNNAKVYSHCTNINTTKAKGIILGAVIGEITGASVIESCKTLSKSDANDEFGCSVGNTATNASNTTSYTKIGGIAAQATAAAVIKNCENAGIVEKTAKGCINCYIGGILGYNVTNAATIKDCVNKRYVGTTQDAYNTAHIGGILGYCEGVGTSIDGCSVTNVIIGNVASDARKTVSYAYYGGIVGRYDGEGTISNCTNAGTVTNKGKSVKYNTSTAKWDGIKNGYRAGGIVGAVNCGTGKTLTITACHNTGDVKSENDALTQYHIMGGILGAITGGSIVISDCTSECSVVSAYPSTATVGLIAGSFNGAEQTANHNGVSGSLTGMGALEGVTLDAENYSSHLWTVASGKSVTTTVPNYFIGSSAGTTAAPLTQTGDNKAW